MTTTFNVSRLRRMEVDEDNRVMLLPPSNKPLPATVYTDDNVIIVRAGDAWLAEVLDFHDCYVHGGEPSYLWVQLR